MFKPLSSCSNRFGLNISTLMIDVYLKLVTEFFLWRFAKKLEKPIQYIKVFVFVNSFRIFMMFFDE